MSGFGESGDITVAVVTGRHPFDVPAFQAAFRSIPDTDCYLQHMEDYAADAGGVRSRYDVVVFYNMHMETPTGEGPWYDAGIRGALEQLGETPQGILVLHHALLAFPQWPLWCDLVGLRDRSFGYYMDQEIRVEIADPDHPITAGLSAWDMVDETYTTGDAGADSHILLTVDHPNSMRTVGWTRTFGRSPVFCLQLGHDARAFGHPMFREVLGRGICWLAGRLG